MGIIYRSYLLALILFAVAFLTAPLCVRAEDFDWRNIGGYSFVTPVKNQDGSGMCSTFASTGALEAKYQITRNDPTYFTLDLSEQQLDCAGIVDWTKRPAIHT